LLSNSQKFPVGAWQDSHAHMWPDHFFGFATALRSGEIPFSTKEAIACLLCTPSKSLTSFNVQQQSNNYDCGLFALAYASSICDGVDPTTVTYKKYALRSHFLKCLKKGKFYCFPTKPVQRSPGHSLKSIIRVYCMCRLPDSGDHMIKCTEWYHYTCVGIEQGKKIDGIIFIMALSALSEKSLLMYLL